MPRASSVSAFARVAGCAHIRGFIAGATSTGPAVGERGFGEEVVGDAVGELRERVRGARRDDEQVGPGQVQIEVLVRRAARESLEGLGADEALRAGRDERDTSWPALTSRRVSSQAL